MQAAAARKASGIRDPVQGDDKFIRRSSWNAEQINAAAMANQQPPPVVDINNYVPPPPSNEGLPFYFSWFHYKLCTRSIFSRTMIVMIVL